MKNEVFEGEVKFFLSGENYGFIIEDKTQKDFYFHITGTATKQAVQKGARVSFNVVPSKQGVKAVNVTELK